MPKTLKARIAKRKDLTDDLFILWLELENGNKFKFDPGQYCTIGLSDSEGNLIRDSEDKLLVRPYSIVSAPHEDYLELFVEFVPRKHGGNLTPLLHDLEVGETVDILPRAKGIFTFEPEYKNHVMVATVTGIVPYISIIRDYIKRVCSWDMSCRGVSTETEHKFFVLQGASYWDEFAYDHELNDLTFKPPAGLDLVYIPTVSRPKETRNINWSRQRRQAGRVNEILEDYLDLWELSSDDTLVYVCGHPGMIEDAKERLLSKGWHVKEERFWKE